MSEMNDEELNEHLEDFEVHIEAGFAQEALPTMEKIRRNGQLCDIKLQAGDSFIHAHRVVLAGSIPYFYVMFTSDMIEAKKDEVNMIGMESEALEALVNFAYTGKIVLNVNNVQSIMLCASFLQMNNVREACAKFLTKRLQPDNVLGIKIFADRINDCNLVKNADKFIQKYFKKVSKCEEFFQLEVEDILNIISRDELSIDNEEQVYLIMMDWIKKSPELRSQYLPQLLKCIRMPLLTPKFITDNIASEPYIKSSHECRDLLDETRDYFLIPDRRPFMKTFVTKPRCSSNLGQIFVIGGINKAGDAISTVEQFDPLSENWKSETNMKMLRSRVGVAVVRNQLYAIGGFNGTERLATIEVFNSVVKSWTKVPSMNYKRSALGSCCLNDRFIFVCGGYDGSSSLNTVEIFDVEKLDGWTLGPSMQKSRSAAGVVSIGNAIYSIGGHDGMAIFDSVEKFEFGLQTWTFVAPMTTKRCRLGSATLRNKIYVAGGYNGTLFLNSCEFYDPATNVWTMIAPLAIQRSRVALCSMGSKLWAVGGYDGISNLSSMEVYCPEKDQWKNSKSMIEHEGGVGIGVIPLSF